MVCKRVFGPSHSFPAPIQSHMTPVIRLQLTRFRLSFFAHSEMWNSQKIEYSPGFNCLLPGMYSIPLHVVPKDGGTSLCLVTNHSKEPFSLNSMIDKGDMGSFPLDNMKHLGVIYLSFISLCRAKSWCYGNQMSPRLIGSSPCTHSGS